MMEAVLKFWFYERSSKITKHVRYFQAIFARQPRRDTKHTRIISFKSFIQARTRRLAASCVCVSRQYIIKYSHNVKLRSYLMRMVHAMMALCSSNNNNTVH